MSIEAAIEQAHSALSSDNRDHVLLCIARLQGLLDLEAHGADEQRVMAALIPLMNRLETLK